MNYDVCLIGAKDTTLTLSNKLIESGHKIDLIVTVDSGTVNTEMIAGFASFADYAKEHNIELFCVSDYAMQDQDTRSFFSQNDFGIGICMGWQRLIPKEILSCFKAGIFGFHGSCGYLPYGRGRSPLNWSIINGDTRFILNMFRYDEFADSPNVFQQQLFEITPFDSIRTLQYKNIIAAYSMSTNLLKQYKACDIAIQTETCDPDTQFSKRSPEDGRINFLMKTREIYNLVRAVTKPFPGAFCFDSLTREEVTIWDAAPFDQFLNFSNYAPGEVIDVFDEMPVIRTIDGSLIIKNYDSSRTLIEGDRLC